MSGHLSAQPSLFMQHFLGHFKSEEDGARAYDRALLIRKKKDGCLNFPLADYQNCAEHPSPQAPDSVKPKQAPDGGLDTGTSAL